MKGAYFITKIDNEIYSTDSIFWHSFFTDVPLPGTKQLIKKRDLKKINWDIVTFNGKIIHEFNQVAK